MHLRYSARAGNRIVKLSDRRPGDLARWTPVVTVLIYGGSIQAWLDWPRPKDGSWETPKIWSTSGDANR